MARSKAGIGRRTRSRECCRPRPLHEERSASTLDSGARPGIGSGDREGQSLAHKFGRGSSVMSTSGDGAVRFSYCMLPDYPLVDSIDMIRVADELGYYACYSVDETWHKDLWCMFAAAADKTRNIRLGPNVTHVFLREPTLICQQLATLDELSGGRAAAVVSTGNFVMMEQYHLDWANRRPLSRLREAMHVMRTFLDDGKIDYEGDVFKYTGLFTA